VNTSILIELHEILLPYDNICPRNCFLCENYETAMLLPNEEKLIGTNPELINRFLKHDEGFFYLDINTDCPFFCEEDKSGECQTYCHRPVDCRIFPFFPKFDLMAGTYTLIKSNWYCPINDASILKMERDVRKVLDVVNMNVSVEWKRTYNELNYQRIKDKLQSSNGMVNCCHPNNL
jgi:Fe-S-cluster containining protein